MRLHILLAWLIWAAVSFAKGDGLADNNPTLVRPVPPKGIEVPAEKRAKLEAELADLQARIDKLQNAADQDVSTLLPDVKIYHKAVDWALRYDEFFREQEIEVAFELLATGRERAEQLAQGKAPWTTATGLVVRGYLSKIDGSVQPYGLVVPEEFHPDESPFYINHRKSYPHRHRLDVWCHGRGETLSELNFVQDRSQNKGQITTADTVVLHPYGRFCNASKFAGEADVLEAIKAVKRGYPIDNDRLVIRGFSMGGASAWHLAVHYPTTWAAANPGAGFAETPEFLKFFQKEELHPTWWERKLWHWYDCPDWVGNLRSCPTVAYSGENDIQKQAADIMAAAAKQDGFEIPHIIGPGTGHSYHPDSAAEVERRLADLITTKEQGYPREWHFTTYMLRYWWTKELSITALREHWKEARVDVVVPDRDHAHIEIKNVTRFSFRPAAGFLTEDAKVVIRDTSANENRKFDEKLMDGSIIDWSPVDPETLFEERFKTHKGPDLQGPIDDAFMSSFLFIRPTGKCSDEAVEKWVHAEMDRAIREWRRQFRGDARLKDDRDITSDDISSHNLILWGDAISNSVIAKIADKLPIKIDGNELVVGERRFDAAHHVPILIYPNPLHANPNSFPHYIVLNSGFTFREYAYLNNARQVAKLPDWAIVDIRTPPDSLWPGKIVDADFFDESWQLKPPHKEE